MGMNARKIIVGLLCLLLATGCTKTNHKDTSKLPVIKIGSDDYSPFNYLNQDGLPTGIDVDLATEAFARIGYQVQFEYIDWEEKKNLVEAGEIDCIWGCFSMEGRLDDYNWAGPYMLSNQVVAVNADSDIQSLSNLEGKNMAVQSTTKPEEILLNKDSEIPQLNNLISLENRDLIFTFLGKGYVDAIAGHETFILQHMKDYNVKYRILEEPLMQVGIGVAFAKNDTRGICEKLNTTLKEMRQDGTSKKIIKKYLNHPQKYLEVDQLEY